MSEYRPRIWWRVPRFVSGREQNDRWRFKVKTSSGVEHPAEGYYEVIIPGSNASSWNHIERLCSLTELAVNQKLSSEGVSCVVSFKTSATGFVTISADSDFQIACPWRAAPTPAAVMGFDSSLDAPYAASHTAPFRHYYGVYIAGGIVSKADLYVECESFEAVGQTMAGAVRAGGLICRKELEFQYLTASELADLRFFYGDAKTLPFALIEDSSVDNFQNNYRLSAEGVRTFSPKRVSPALERYNLTLKLLCATETGDDMAYIEHDHNDSYMPLPTIISVASETYNLSADDKNVELVVVRTASGPCSITLSSSLMNTIKRLLIKDAAKNASQNQIRVLTEGSETIDGLGELVVDSNGAAVELFPFNGSWHVY